MKTFIKTWLFCIAIFSQTGIFAQAITTTNVSANGNCDGSATYNYGGTVVSWNSQYSNLIVQTGGSTANNLCSGNYYALIQDTMATVDSLYFYIDTFSLCNGFSVSITAIDASPASCDGTADPVITGGTAPYTYFWSTNSITSTLSSLENLCAGWINLELTDANGCLVYDQTYIYGDSIPDTTNNPCDSFDGNIITTYSQDSIQCDGTATVVMIGNPAGTLSYLWNTGETTSSIAQLCAGNFSCNITSSLGCTIYLTGYVWDSTQNNSYPLDGYVYTSDESLSGTCDGSATVYAYSGTPGYTFLHSNGATTQTASNLCPGVYSVLITDATGSTVTLTYMIANDSNVWENTPDSTVVDSSSWSLYEDCTFDYSSIDTAFVSIFNWLTADSVAVTYSISDATGVHYFTETYYFGGGNGTYNVNINVYCPTKSTGKFLKITGQVEKGSNAGITVINETEANVYPNPFNETLNITLEKAENVEVKLFDLSGRNVVSESFINTSTIELTSLSNLAKGEYILYIQTTTGVVTKKVIK